MPPVGGGHRAISRGALTPFQCFAEGLRENADAVQAAVALPWSQGPVERHITRLKRLTRQMCGRTHLDLLARRLLLAG
jgi:transposase